MRHTVEKLLRISDHHICSFDIYDGHFEVKLVENGETSVESGGVQRAAKRMLGTLRNAKQSDHTNEGVAK